MATVLDPIQLKRIDTQLAASLSSMVLKQGQLIRIEESGRVIWGQAPSAR